MRVLYLHQYFRKPNHGGAIRSYYLAKALVDAGVEVDLITSHSHENVRIEVVDGIKVHFLPVRYDNKLPFWRRIISFFSFMIRSYLYARKMKKVDRVYATSTPLTVGITALLLKKIHKIPYFFEVRDLWPEAPIQMGAIRNRIVKYFLRKLESLIYRNADKVIALSPGMLEGVAKVIPEEKIELIPNISDCSFFEFGVKNIKDNFYFGVTDKIVVSYLGAIGKVNNLDSLIDVAEECKQQGLKEVVFLIAGKGGELPRIKQLVKDKNLSNVRFVGFLNRNDIQRLLNATDISFISFADKPILETNSPNKFFDSIAAGKMCVVNNKGWIKDIIERHEIGFYYPSKQPIMFVEKLKDYVYNLGLLKKAGLNARKLAESNFSRKQLTQQFVAAFDLQNVRKDIDAKESRSARA